MSVNLSSFNKNSFDQLDNQVSNLITQRVIHKAKAIIQVYNGKSDAILLSEGLYQIKNMFIELKETEFDQDDIRWKMMFEELQYRWKEIDYIIAKARKERPKPVLTKSDVQNIESIRGAMDELFGKKDALPTKNILPFLLEAARK